MKRLLAESLGTFFLVFSGTGAIVLNQLNGGLIGHAGIALVFGLAVLIMIHTFGDISGAHLNPAVTVGFAAAHRFPWKDVLPYVGAQFIGAFTASVLIKELFPLSVTLGTTLPAGSILQSFILETVLTGTLMLTILSVSSGAKEKGLTAGLTIGSMIALGAMFAGPISGASMNPARSLAPALVSGHLEHFWLYPLATILGALSAVPACMGVREPGCCGGKC